MNNRTDNNQDKKEKQIIKSSKSKKNDNVKKKKVISKKAREELLSAMKETKLELESVRISFQFVDEPNLIEALIYKEQEILARYNYLIKEMKLKKVKATKNELYKNICKVC